MERVGRESRKRGVAPWLPGIGPSHYTANWFWPAATSVHPTSPLLPLNPQTPTCQPASQPPSHHAPCSDCLQCGRNSEHTETYQTPHTKTQLYFKETLTRLTHSPTKLRIQRTGKQTQIYGEQLFAKRVIKPVAPPKMSYITTLHRGVRGNW